MPETCSLLFLVLPQKPVYGDLGTQDGEEEGEDAVLEVVAVGGVDDEGAGDGEGRDDEEERNAEDGEAEGPADGSVAAGFVARRVRGAGHGRVSPLFRRTLWRLRACLTTSPRASSPSRPA